MQQPADTDMNDLDLETQARKIAASPAKQDGKLEEARSATRRFNVIIAASLPKCKWQGVDPKKPSSCVDLVFNREAIFCKKHHKKAQDEWGYGKDVMSMYPDWNKDLEVAPIVPVKTNIRPFNDFKKSPEEVVDTVDSQGGARFKTAYVSNIRAAKNVTKCESCGEHKIEVLTDASTLICLPCFHSGKGFVKGQINGATDIPVGATGWPSAGKLKPLRSQQADRKSSPSEEGDRPPPPALGNRSVSRRRQHSPEDKRGRKASRTESRHNPSSNIPQAPAEGNAGGPINSDAPVLEDNVDSLEEEDNPKSVPTSPTSQALAAFEQLNVTSNTESA